MTWQPMETAPKDGREIVVYFSGDFGESDKNIRPKKQARAYDSIAAFPHPKQLRWNEHLDYWQESSFGFEIAITEDGMMGWMPLPDGIKSDATEFHWTPVKHEDIYKA